MRPVKQRRAERQRMVRIAIGIFGDEEIIADSKVGIIEPDGMLNG